MHSAMRERYWRWKSLLKMYRRSSWGALYLFRIGLKLTIYSSLPGWRGLPVIKRHRRAAVAREMYQKYNDITVTVFLETSKRTDFCELLITYKQKYKSTLIYKGGRPIRWFENCDCYCKNNCFVCSVGCLTIGYVHKLKKIV